MSKSACVCSGERDAGVMMRCCGALKVVVVTVVGSVSAEVGGWRLKYVGYEMGANIIKRGTREEEGMGEGEGTSFLFLLLSPLMTVREDHPPNH